MARADFAFFTRIRVRWSEVDPQSVVFNARYLDYADIGVTEYWRAIKAAGMWGDATLECHVAKAEVLFKKPIFADEELDLFVRTSRFGTTSMTTLVEIHGAGETDDLRAAIELIAVHIDLADHRPRPIPEAARTALSRFDSGNCSSPDLSASCAA
jgi:acyl-CoA thioester hydrolase